ncbi:NAD-dependent epimerase/dehydratase family protein [Polymorphum gilvum]|uniref:GDP-mannose dehydratase family n=1 Tax=Polymorphum gilvum (strain LMG 25793 / CGMCC 1.9160 / SL003B-26A1) TaxID=991905 RepID=F2J3F5_POLGS|nr:NAD-dependent epimerase/dehydratase family protein [Polymorphum gilvum]ADZ70980.1 GDP-mannose dehydratase family [Polymorphum gilvum SL003B-26A1]
MVRKILVTGADGFVGRHLCRRLESGPGAGAFEVIRTAKMPVDASLAFDLENPASVEAAVAASRPDAVIHLAAISTAYLTDGTSERVWRVNYEGTAALAAALRRHVPGAGLIFASSAEVYGASLRDGQPKRETDPVAPESAYAKSKLAAELMLEATLAQVSPVVALRLFNHVGPGQDERFALPAFAAQIARIEKGASTPVIKVGNLSAKRDFLDVVDVIEVYRRVLDLLQAPAGYQLFNVSSGKPREISELLDKMIALSSVPITREVDPDRLRDINIPVSCGNSEKIRAVIDWSPRVNIDETLIEILDYWRNRIPPVGQEDPTQRMQ